VSSTENLDEYVDSVDLAPGWSLRILHCR